MRCAAVLLALACACGDNLGGPSDAGPIDARHFADANRAACGADAGCAGEPLTPVCDLDRAICVECVAEADCDREDALGPRCAEALGYCQCGEEEECEGNPNGPRCHPVARACTCIDDGDCAGDRTCEMEPYLGGGVRTCRSPTVRDRWGWEPSPSGTNVPGRSANKFRFRPVP